MDFVKFLLWLWDYEENPRIRDLLAHKQSLSRTHAYNMQSQINTYYAPFFRCRTVATITRQDLKAFSLHLAENAKTQRTGEALSPRYINIIMKAAITALTWAAKEHLIPVNPAAGLTLFSETTGKKRGVLTMQEAEVLFRIKWPNKNEEAGKTDRRAMIGSLVAMTTGMRVGEVLALKKSDIDPVKPIISDSKETLELTNFAIFRVSIPNNVLSRFLLPILPLLIFP
jgi:integrase